MTRWETAVCLLLGCFPGVAFGLSIGKSRIIVSKDDFKSSQPLTTNDMMEWIPWHQGEIATQTPNSYILDKHVESEYRKWARLHGKQPDPVHYQAFRQNYLDLLGEAEEGHGGQPFFHLNQYGDMTQEEHKQEMLMLEAYHNWCQHHNKRQDPRRFDAFKQNLIRAVIETEGNMEREIHLGEFADCFPRSKNHCIEPLYSNGEHYLPSNSVQEIGNGVYVEDDGNHYYDDTFYYETEVLPTFLESRQQERWKEPRFSPYSDLHP